MSIAAEYAIEWKEYNGRIVTVDGLRWKLRFESYRAIYPYPHEVANVSLEPTSATKRSEAYLTIKRELGDDWSTDVLSSEPEFQAELLQQLQK